MDIKLLKSVKDLKMQNNEKPNWVKNYEKNKEKERVSAINEREKKKQFDAEKDRIDHQLIYHLSLKFSEINQLSIY